MTKSTRPQPIPDGASPPIRLATALAVACSTAVAHAESAAGFQDPPQNPPGQSQPANQPAPTPPEGGSSVGKGWFRGTWTNRYYLRSNGDDSDNDVVSLLTLDLGHADKDRVTGHFAGRMSYDLDGRDGSFQSIDDSRGGPFDAYVYDAYADIHQIKGFELVRIGRQSVYETPEVAFFDGAHVALEPMGALQFQLGGYGGMSTHLYESAHSGDLTAGAYAQVRPWTGNRMRVDYMHLEDEARFGSHENDLLGGGVWQSITRYVDVDGQYSRIEDRDRDAQGHLLVRVPEWKLLTRFGYYRLLEDQGSLVIEADPFFQALNEVHPYDEWSAMAAVDVAEHVRVQGSTDLRRVDDEADIGFYNRDYDHYAATVGLFDLQPKGLSLDGTLDLWNSNGQTIKTWGGSVTYEFGKTRLSAGSSYSLYKYDLFSNSEKDHVRTYFVRLRHKLNDSVSVDGDYEFEDETLDTSYRLRLGVTWRF